MQLIDTHCHLFLEEFDTDRIEIISKSIESGVVYLINPNVDVLTIDALYNTCQINPTVCLPALGLHPCSVKEDYKEQLNVIKQHIDNKKPIAIGEIGIDLYWDKTYYNQQKLALDEQLQWAVGLNLPVLLHNREAFEIVFEIVKKHSQLKGVFHAFSGNADQAKQVLTTNFYFGIGGVVTFKNAGLDKIVKEIPIERILLETDSPYLTPVPHRGKRNEPSYVNIVAEKIAEIKGISTKDVASITTQNAKSLFGI